MSEGEKTDFLHAEFSLLFYRSRFEQPGLEGARAADLIAKGSPDSSSPRRPCIREQAPASAMRGNPHRGLGKPKLNLKAWVFRSVRRPRLCAPRSRLAVPAPARALPSSACASAGSGLYRHTSWTSYSPILSDSRSRASRLSRRQQPSKQEEVVAAQRAPVGQKQPVDASLQEIPDAHLSEIDRAAMRTPRGQHDLRASKVESGSLKRRVTSGFDSAGRCCSSDGLR